MHNPLSQMGRQIVMGSMMGDGFLEITHSSRHARFVTRCAEKYKDYLLWKYRHLQSVCHGEPQLQMIYREDGRAYSTYSLWTRVHSMFTRLRHYLYPEGRRIVSGKILNRLGDVGLATWVCDDGYLRLNYDVTKTHIRSRALILHIERYNPPCCDVIRRWFKECYDVQAKLQVHQFSPAQQRPLLYLYINTYDAYYKIRPIIAPIIEDIPSMWAKVDFKYVEGERSHTPRLYKTSLSATQVIREWYKKHPAVLQAYPDALYQ